MLARLHVGNITIREAAARCGLNYATWSNWERGMEPRGLLAVVDKISQGLGVDRDWLLFGGPLAEADANRERWYGQGRANSARPGRPLGGSTVH